MKPTFASPVRPPSSPEHSLKVVIITTTLPAQIGDGTPEFVLTLARSLPGVDVTLIAPRTPGSAREETIDGVRIRRVAYFPRRWEGLASDAIMPTLRAEPWRLIEVPFLVVALLVATLRAVDRHHEVVLNPHWIVPSGLIALVVGRLTGVPYVVTGHGADAYTLRGGLAGRVKQVVVDRAAAVLPVSADIARTLGLEGAPVLRMGVDTRAIRRAVGTRHAEPGLLVYLGRLADKKGVDVLIEAMAQLPGARLEIVGSGPAGPALEDMVVRLGLAERVRFAGKLPKHEVLSMLARAMAVVIPSRVGADGDMEGTPVVLGEAMAAGVPVVASDLGGLGECIEHGETGLLVAPDDVDGLAATLRAVLDGSVDLEAIGRAAADNAQHLLDIGSVGAAYARVLSSAAAR